MQTVAAVLKSRHGNIIHRRCQRKVLKRDLVMTIGSRKPAILCNPRILLFSLLAVHESLKEQPVMIIQPHAVAGKSKRRNGIQKTGRKPSKTSVAQGRLRLHLFNLRQIAAVFFQYASCLFKQSQINQIIGQQLPD